MIKEKVESNNLKTAFIQLEILSRTYDYFVPLSKYTYLFTEKLPIYAELEEDKKKYPRSVGDWCFMDYSLEEAIIEFDVELPIMDYKKPRVYKVREYTGYHGANIPAFRKASNEYRKNEEKYNTDKLINLIGQENYEEIVSVPYRDLGLRQILNEEGVALEFYDLASHKVIGEQINLDDTTDFKEDELKLYFICSMTNVRVLNESDESVEVLNEQDDAKYLYCRYYEREFDTYHPFVTHFGEYNAIGEMNASYEKKWFNNIDEAKGYGKEFVKFENLRDQKYTTHVEFMVFQPGTRNDDIPVHTEIINLRNREEHYNKYYSHLM